VKKYEVRRQRNGSHSRVLGQVLERDPSFAADRFLQDFKSAFIAIQESWMTQDMASVRYFFSVGIDEDFAIQFREQQRLGYREQLDGIKVRATRLARSDSTGPFEVLTVEVRALMVDQRVSLKTGATIGGSSTAGPFTEYWSLVRRRGTQTRQHGADCWPAVVPTAAGRSN
jgi:predicted lipid-binding transport protein (Tim44 family)